MQNKTTSIVNWVGIFVAGITLATLVVPARALASTFTVIHRFHGADGANPNSTLIFNRDTHTLYGTTYNGGANNLGTIFSLTRNAHAATWTHEVLHSFDLNSGHQPFAGLVKSGRLFYGVTTSSAYPNFSGTAFVFDPADKAYRTIYDFSTDPGVSGSDPQPRLHVWNGRIYGANAVEGAGGGGTIFELSRPDTPGTQWNLRILENFSGDNGFNAAPGFAMQKNGDIFGNTYSGGPVGAGVVYALNHVGAPDSGRWNAELLSRFKNAPDGVEPYGEILVDGPDRLVGVTNRGGVDNVGTIFQLTLKDGHWKRKTVVSFPYVEYGPQYMNGGLVKDSHGNYYGASTYGGAFGNGCVFRLSPPPASIGQWQMTLLHHFRTQQGVHPQALPVVDESTGKVVLYGTAEEGGSGPYGGNGAVYMLKP